MWASRTVAPAGSATARSVLMTALYSWSVVRISSPGWNISERMTALTPVVALGTKTRPSGSACRNAPRRSRTSTSSPGSSRSRKRTGCRSRRSRQAACASMTGAGQAPNEPWLRNVQVGSRRNPRSVRIRRWSGRASRLRRRRWAPSTRARASGPRPRRRRATVRRVGRSRPSARPTPARPGPAAGPR